MSKGGATGIRRILNAARYSAHGLAWAFRHEAAVRQEIALLIATVPLGLYLGKTGIERALLCASVVLVLIVELLNTAVEAAVDRIGTERHTLSGLAKDLGSAAVLIALLNAALVWTCVLIG